MGGINVSKNKFFMINVDGPDGSGKTTLVNGLLKHYSKYTNRIGIRHFPRYDTELGKVIQKKLFGKITMDPRAFQMLCSADRINFNKIDLPAIKQQLDILIVDRYLTSGIVYGLCTGVEAEDILDFDSTSAFPNVNFILKVTPNICMQRLEAKKRDTFETSSFQSDACYYYNNLLNKYFCNVTFLDGTKSAFDVLKDAIDILNPQIKKVGIQL